ncbi:unnamed protein product [Amoebophrya sp. A120]|nr:unnamed protein product [Amoebophrya sp. A120]|eukprot:GSA120T00010438001.1
MFTAMLFHSAHIPAFLLVAFGPLQAWAEQNAVELQSLTNEKKAGIDFDVKAFCEDAAFGRQTGVKVPNKNWQWKLMHYKEQIDVPNPYLFNARTKKEIHLNKPVVLVYEENKDAGTKFTFRIEGSVQETEKPKFKSIPRLSTASKFRVRVSLPTIDRGVDIDTKFQRFYEPMKTAKKNGDKAMQLSGALSPEQKGFLCDIVTREENKVQEVSSTGSAPASEDCASTVCWESTGTAKNGHALREAFAMTSLHRLVALYYGSLGTRFSSRRALSAFLAMSEYRKVSSLQLFVEDFAALSEQNLGSSWKNELKLRTAAAMRDNFGYLGLADWAEKYQRMAARNRGADGDEKDWFLEQVWTKEMVNDLGFKKYRQVMQEALSKSYALNGEAVSEMDKRHAKELQTLRAELKKGMAVYTHQTEPVKPSRWSGWFPSSSAKKRDHEVEEGTELMSTKYKRGQDVELH